MNGSVALSDIKGLVPLSGLSYENQSEIARKSSIMDVTEGTLVFEQGQVCSKTFYLLNGEIELSNMLDS